MPTLTHTHTDTHTHTHAHTHTQTHTHTHMYTYKRHYSDILSSIHIPLLFQTSRTVKLESYDGDCKPSVLLIVEFTSEIIVLSARLR